MGAFVHACEGEMVCESINPKVPYFNAPIFLENKVQMFTTISIYTTNIFRRRLAKSMRSSARSTKSISPSSHKTVSSRHRLSLATSSTSAGTSYYR